MNIQTYFTGIVISWSRQFWRVMKKEKFVNMPNQLQSRAGNKNGSAVQQIHENYITHKIDTCGTAPVPIPAAA